MNYEGRGQRLRQIMGEKQIDVCLIWDPDNQYYFSGFRAISYSRPIVYLVCKDQTDLIVPALEELHAAEKARGSHIHVYYEQIEMAHKESSYRDHLDKLLARYPKGARLGVEMNSLSAGMFLYLQKKGFELADIGLFIMEMRFIKDSDEIALLKVAGQLSDYAVAESLSHARVGISELELDAYGDKLLLEMASDLYENDIIGYENWTCSGPNSVKPHLYSSTRKFEPGDVVIHSRQVWFNGYRAENERTFIVGKPTEKQKDLFKLAVEAQRVGMEMIKPGIAAREVDLAAYEVFKKAGYGEYVNHRIGHGLGLTEHEEPYLRFDNSLVLQEGMVFTIEPGVYVPGVGGFRHSDTVILTKEGSFSITQHTRNVEDLIFQ
ncbi:M24 family metallopeptidase [Brevibacillus sp. NRS-1366]|uniref:M24 family metallopeptidase n=1 Tax=Brevibacillus sp. NRS-1366 TaxID=3233899 RepID=UPI003D1B80CA